jgi:indolepyruvate ferredoxin oxidoreductase, beta subunit
MEPNRSSFHEAHSAGEADGGTSLIVAGVGGQGILSISYVLDNAALDEGWCFKQSEVHGMSQRGGAVQSHLRFSRSPVWSDLVPEGDADLVLSVEPLEALRYAHYLRPGGWLVTSADPFVNIPNYPEIEGVYARIREHAHVLVEADALARKAGSPRSSNMVMLGAASVFLPFSSQVYHARIDALFGSKGERVLGANHAAFDAGRAVALAARG